jgi:Ala-tRNA(Pro) deacylase
MTAASHLTRETLMVRLESLGLSTKTIDHKPVFTVAESAEIETELQSVIPGAATKNLFLKDAKDRLFLFVAEAHASIDMKALHKRIGSARLSFGKADLLEAVLGVTAGSVTAFAIANATPDRVTLLLDKTIAEAERVNCHPLTNTATTNIAVRDLMVFFAAHGHRPAIVDLTAPLAV